LLVDAREHVDLRELARLDVVVEFDGAWLLDRGCFFLSVLF
jgi:hypothetical protein